MKFTDKKQKCCSVKSVELIGLIILLIHLTSSKDLYMKSWRFFYNAGKYKLIYKIFELENYNLI